MIILLGSILPATGGKIGILFKSEFWRQKFIYYIIIGEASYGLYSAILSYNYSDNHGDNFECFILSRLGFILVFCFVFIFSEKMRKTVIQLKNVSMKYKIYSNRCFLLSFLAEVLTQIALFLANYAYKINKNVYT